MFANFLGWSAVLLAQNYSFTYVSRARNSNSLARHAKAAAFSNGIWIFSQMLMLGPMFDYLTGKHGLALQAIAAIVYTVSTMTGSLAAHFVSKKTEKGKAAVGANDLYAQIPKGEWERFKRLAEEAHLCAVGGLPDSGISASKFGDTVVKTGMPEMHAISGTKDPVTNGQL